MSAPLRAEAPPALRLSLRRAMASASAAAKRRLHAKNANLAVGEIVESARTPDLAALAGRTVLIRTGSQLAAALALIDLDGVAARVILCPPDIEDADLPGVIEIAGVDSVVSDDAPPPLDLPPVVRWLRLADDPLLRPPTPFADTSWLLFTSGTTGAPKMVAHSFEGLTGAIHPAPSGEPIVWGTFYDVRRYGGLQMLLRALLGAGSMVLSHAGEPVGDFLRRLGDAGVTHLAGTPSHWRRALMSPAIKAVSPRYARLSGEIADQAVLDSLKAVFPGVPVGHAYASTEAGVGFEVDDGLEGFPAAFMDRRGEVEMKVVDGTLRVRSRRTASGYVGPGGTLADADGFVDTGDLVERRGERFYFMGRASGVINVGGLKVHPEEVEAVINAVPGVRMARVRARKSPITGALVAAEVVAEDPAAAGPALKAAILDACRAALAPHKTPAMIAFVDSLPMTAGGKLERRGA